MTRPELLPGAPLRGGLLLPRDEALPPVPLEHSAIEVEVTGPLAVTSVTQRFRNGHHTPLDALYVFPLPAEAAVSELELRVGARTIRGEVRARAEAEAAFREAADRGADAALLTRERPNLFAVELANLQPGEPVEVRLRLFGQVPYDDGWFTLAIPTVTLPRYVPAGEPSGPREGVVPLLPEGAAGHTLGVRVSLDLGRELEVVPVGSDFDITLERGRTVATLRDPGAVPDRDIVLRYRPAGEGYSAAAFAYRAAGQPGAALLMLTPRAAPEAPEVLPRELLFVFDRSGSMGGESIAQARNALRACLRSLNSGDTFNIFPFDNHVERLAPAPLPFTQQSVDAADAFIAGIEARGGTEIVGALSAALEQPRDQGRLRVVVFLTDGAVGNEDEVLRALADRLNEARVFAFGVGSAVNRFLLDRLAAVGRGSAEYIMPGEPIEPAVQRFQRRAAMPLVCDLSVDWGGLRVSDELPAPLPDLYAGQPLVMLARYAGADDQAGTVTVRGRTARGPLAERLEVELPAATPDRRGAWAALPKLWARARIAALEDMARLDRGRAATYEAEAKALALEHGLLSGHTALVAVEEHPTGAEGRRATARTVVPVHLPAGTRREAFEPDPPWAGGLPRGALYAMAPAAMAAPARASAHRQSAGGIAQKFLNALQGDVARMDAAGAPPPEAWRPPAPLGAPAPATGGGPAGPAARAAAAPRLPARTQEVGGAWAGDRAATALAALAFALAGHTAQRGDFRPQLGRAAAWLRDRQGDPATALALRALDGEPADPVAARALAEAAAAAAGLDPERLAAAQRLGGDADGAVLRAGAAHLRPSAETLALTAALAILVAG